MYGEYQACMQTQVHLHDVLVLVQRDVARAELA